MLLKVSQNQYEGVAQDDVKNMQQLQKQQQ